MAVYARLLADSEAAAVGEGKLARKGKAPARPGLWCCFCRSTRKILHIGCKGSLGRASPCQGFWPARGKLGTPYAPLNEMRLAHLPLKRHHDLGMGVGEDKPVERGLPFPDGEGPGLPREEPRPQRVPEQARSPSQLPPDAPRVAQEGAQIARAPHRYFGQHDQVFPLRVWSVQCEPWRRWHGAASGTQDLRLLLSPREAADLVFLNVC